MHGIRLLLQDYRERLDLDSRREVGKLAVRHVCTEALRPPAGVAYLSLICFGKD